MKKLAQLLFMASVPIALFSACTGNTPTAQNSFDTPLYSFSNNASPSGDTANPVLGASDSSQTASQTSPLSSPIIEPKGPIVKTLKDFTPITAKEATVTTNKGDITFTLFA